MFEQLSTWHSKISLRGAVVSAIGFGFVAGMGLGIFVLSVLRLQADPAQLVGMLVQTVFALAMAIQMYFLAMSRIQEKQHTS